MRFDDTLFDLDDYVEYWHTQVRMVGPFNSVFDVCPVCYSELDFTIDVGYCQTCGQKVSLSTHKPTNTEYTNNNMDELLPMDDCFICIDNGTDNCPNKDFKHLTYRPITCMECKHAKGCENCLCQGTWLYSRRKD